MLTDIEEDVLSDNRKIDYKIRLKKKILDIVITCLSIIACFFQLVASLLVVMNTRKPLDWEEFVFKHSHLFSLIYCFIVAMLYLTYSRSWEPDDYYPHMAMYVMGWTFCLAILFGTVFYNLYVFDREEEELKSETWSSFTLRNFQIAICLGYVNAFLDGLISALITWQTYDAYHLSRETFDSVM